MTSSSLSRGCKIDDLSGGQQRGNGGGSRNRLLSQATADAAGVPVASFSLEGTAVGNIASQLIALRVVKDLRTFRALLGADLKQKVYAPRRG